ncbi:restriction endonuclease subunit S [Zoogloea sp.]|uniref:restriction endonuclease subunit S n=1 Tax=Zoogloea sp. TaxID=49181 RepID=UPI0025D4D3C2|nr:restriction endonuclease subunit S [Zoogloea sp.]
MGEIAEWAIGSGFPTEAQGENDQEILFSKVSDMNLLGNEKYIVTTVNSISRKTAEKIKAKAHPPGTVVFPKIGGAIATNKRRILVRETAIDNNCLGLTPGAGITTDYLYLLLSSVDLSAYQSGTSVPALSQGNLELIVAGLPPLSEQHRIVAKVNELMALCDQLERQTDASLGAHQTLVETLLSALTSAADHAQFAIAWQRIASHFDTLFTTEESIAQLKQTILQLAVMGKLVPQDPNDEPVSELLKKIAAEKAKLVKEGKIKNTKQLLPIAEDEKPFKLPSGWAFCRLQELVSTLGDGLHGTPIYDNAGDYHFINGNNLSNGDILIKPDTRRVGQTEYEKHRKELNNSTVLVSINGTIGNVAFFKGEQVILGKSACYFNVLPGIEKLFIKRLIESPLFFHYAASQATGSTISNLGLKAMNAFPIPLPPTSEQVRIIAKLDELFALCDQLNSRLNAAQTTQLHLADALVERATC